MTAMTKQAIRDELLLKEGKLDHAQTMAREKLAKIIVKKKEIEDSVNKIEAEPEFKLLNPEAYRVEVDALVDPQIPKPGRFDRLATFALGFITAVLLLAGLGL